MRLILLRSTCDVGRTCPNINLTDRSTYVVQGYEVADRDLTGHALAADESIVEIPESLLPELAGAEPSRGAIRHTDRETVLVRGRTVVDTEALQQLNLPAGETAVEIPTSVLPWLVTAHAG